MKRVNTYLVILFLLPASLAFAKPTQLNLVVDAPSTLLGSDGKVLQEIPPEKATPLNAQEAIIVQSKGKVPVLLVPHESSRDMDVRLNLQNVADWPSIATSASIDRSLSDLVEGIVEVQNKLTNKDVEGSLRLINELQSKYPNVYYLSFYKASALALQGDKAEAIAALKQALAAHPGNEKGKKLLKALEGSK